jgi:membrane protein YdbS with pleckstrin-like domain
MKELLLKWNPIILAFICLLYSVGLGVLGYTEEAQYSAHWSGTILMFAVAIRQIRKS